uniref:Uncharacterized protein n=1 Tax=Globodera rostochiensis TaxID=31243 RepID=A0A914HY26_GLORO
MDHARCPYVEPKAPLPSYIKAALPNDQKMERIDSIICDLPDTVIDQIPDPPRLAQLPAEVKQRVKQIERQHGKSFGTKFHEIMKYVDTLPDETKSAAKGIFQ